MMAHDTMSERSTHELRHSVMGENGRIIKSVDDYRKCARMGPKLTSLGNKECKCFLNNQTLPSLAIVLSH